MIENFFYHLFVFFLINFINRINSELEIVKIVTEYVSRYWWESFFFSFLYLQTSWVICKTSSLMIYVTIVVREWSLGSKSKWIFLQPWITITIAQHWATTSIYIPSQGHFMQHLLNSMQIGKLTNHCITIPKELLPAWI